jgi:WD40 repeat protein
MNRVLHLLGILFFLTNTGVAQEFDLKPVRTFSGHEHGIRKAVFAPDGKTFATGGTRGEVSVWNIQSGQVVSRMAGHYNSVSDLRYSMDGRFIVTASNDGHVVVWDAASGKTVRKINTSEKASDRVVIHFALLSEDGQAVYFGGEGRKLKMALVGSDEPFRVLYTDRKDPIRCAALSPNGKEIVFAAGQYLMVLDLATNKIAREYNTGTCIINALSYDADGGTLLSWCANARVDMRDAKTFALKTSFRSGSGDRKFSNMALTDDGRYIITGDHASRFHMWDLEGKRLVMDAGANQGTILDFDVQSNPTYLLSASLDRTVKLWQIGEKVEEETKKKKNAAPVQEPAPQVLILTQSETQDDFTPVEVREEPPVQVKMVEQPVVKEAPIPVREEPAPVQEIRPEEVAPVVETLPVFKGDSVSVIPSRMHGRRVNPIRNEHRLNLLSRNLTFQVWDAQVVDGDIISLFINDVCILNEFTIISERKTVNFDASAFKKAYLYLHAHNVGTIPPNTATMMVSDGIQEIQVELRSDLTGSAAMELNFVDP